MKTPQSLSLNPISEMSLLVLFLAGSNSWSYGHLAQGLLG